MNELLNCYQLAVRIANDTSILVDPHEKTLARHAIPHLKDALTEAHLIPPTVTGKPGDDITGLTNRLLALFPTLAADDLTRTTAQHVNQAILTLTQVN